MAALRRAVNKKVQAATIIEVTVAMVIAAISFTLALMIIWQVAASSINKTDIAAELAIENLIARTLEEKSFIDETVEEDQFTMEKTISAYKEEPGVLLLQIIVLNKAGKEMATHRQLVYAEN